MTITATIDRTDLATTIAKTGSVDATIYLDGVEIGEVTLAKDQYDGRLNTWGDCMDLWASHAMIQAIQAETATIEDVVGAVRSAAEEIR